MGRQARRHGESALRVEVEEEKEREENELCMSTKEEKPTLGGVRIRQRKRNINVPLDPASFAEGLLDIFSSAKDEADGNVEGALEGALGGIDQSDLDYNRYNETFFEVLFTGWILSASSSDKGREGDDDLHLNVLAAGATRQEILPYIKFMQMIMRKKPFWSRVWRPPCASSSGSSSFSTRR